ncbi:hypothetical protein PCASD_18756 [Puccinia coronata f. sp. avenae]|uniref:Uncharacterized protein n=1 Tax=Puccinia coronata f. sp. avenae TaxID=200324 RepID=A0A2N5TQV2_9BASI|nr:hypothetical protein PCASD_18756 [Puccinia coronata f. sp. avenae]
MALSLAGPSSARSMDPGNSTPPASSAGGRPTVSTPKTAEEAEKILNSLFLLPDQREFLGKLFQHVYCAFGVQADVNHPSFLRATAGRAQLAGIFSRHQAFCAPNALVREVAPNLQVLLDGMLAAPLPSTKTGRVSLDPTHPRQRYQEMASDMIALGDAHQRFRKIVASLVNPQPSQKIEWAQAINEALYIGTNPQIVKPGLRFLAKRIIFACGSFQAFLQF